MNLGEIAQRVSVELGEQSTFYPYEEMVDSGINPAQRLICLAYPHLLQKRTTIDMSPGQLWVDLRQFAPDVRRVNRAVLGNVRLPDGEPVPATGELRRMLPTHISRLASIPNWLRRHGPVRMYWTYGGFHFGVYERPYTDITVTLIYDAIPRPMALPTDLPDISQIYHQAVVDIAVGLLLVKEGTPESTRGLARVTTTLKGPQSGAVARAS